MKRFLLMLLTLMLLMLTAAQAETPAVDASALVGRWELCRLTMGDMVMDKEAIQATGANLIIELYEDGSAWGDNGREQVDGSWTVEGDGVIVNIDDAPLTFHLTDGLLVSVEYSGAVFTLERVGDAVEKASAAPDLTGRWELCRLTMGDMVMDKEAIQATGANLIIELYEDGSAWGDNGREQLVGSWTVEGDSIIVTIGDAPLTFHLTDGLLVSVEYSGAVFTLERVGDAVEKSPAACVGLWQAASLTNGSLHFDRDAIMNDPRLWAKTMTIELNADGSARSGVGVSWNDGSWTFVDGCVILSIGSKEYVFVLTDGQLIRTVGEDVWTYVREAQE
ncbi:MAG: hypothetical protein IJE07_07570 [Clostridia bacterium]|nr:hypothetical protein [Clostridia bacterium]